jgi:transcriptional regulator with XRE-family HTH domain
MKTRILDFLKAENKSSAQFAEEIGVQPSSISHIISGRNNPSLDFIMKMLNKYPALSTDWLLFGTGLMYREAQLNDLFDVGNNKTNNFKNMMSEDIPNNNFRLQNTQNVAGSNSLTESNKLSGSLKTKRIVCFFDNETFEEYFPAE